MGGSASDLTWKLNRLRNMSLPEMAHRAHAAVQARLEARGIGLARPLAPVGEAGRALSAGPAPAVDPAPYVAAAARILAGHYRIFAIDADIGFPPAWNRCPKTGVAAPMGFGKAIQYREESVVGNIKYLWEPNRHLELVTLAQAWALTGKARFLDGCRTLIDSWIAGCPYPLGPNWTSSLEHAIRLVNWSVAWGLIGGEASPLFAGADGAAFRLRWLGSIRQHLHFVSRHFSLYSSANNHLLGEYLGLVVGCTVWPLWPECAGWLAEATAGFEREALIQNTPDGVNREQAVYYQHEVMDMMLIAGLTLRANGRDFAPAFWQRFESLCAFLHAAMDRAGNMPMIGDSDDALILRLDPRPGFAPWRPLLCAGAILCGRADFALAAGGAIDDKTAWLMPGASLPEVPPGTSRAPRRLAFPEGGYVVIGRGLGGPDEIRLVCDAAPLGYLDIAAHGHADALAFTLSAFGHEWLIDPGTYAYHTEKLWRDHFRATAAHNTVGIDGSDQSQIGGNFMWLHKAQARLIGHGDDWFEGEHDGYRRLADPVGHRRRVALTGEAPTIVVQDRLSAAAAHDVTVNWQFAEGCTVTAAGDAVHAEVGGRRLIVTCAAPGFTLSLHRGEDNPPAGWVSRRFDAKVPATLACWGGTITGDTVIETEMRFVMAE